ncbi:MAG: I78 family peptidase inhibitor [Pseudomonadota bacterium]|nr:I78 family peptidase inhibitor [Pseudomonadota bacterium]
MTHRLLAPLLAMSLTLGLAACAPRAGTAPEASPIPVTTPPAPENSMDESTCNADAARGAIGKTATAAVVEEARRAAGARIARTLKPGQMVTMEYHASRLNIDVDARNVVTNLRCG